jgi:hypothetical protein
MSDGTWRRTVAPRPTVRGRAASATPARTDTKGKHQQAMRSRGDPPRQIRRAPPVPGKIILKDFIRFNVRF